MPDLTTRIRQRLDGIARHITGCCSCTTCEAQDALHAVRAVLDLHQRAECVNVRCQTKGWCVGCDPDGTALCDEHPHPCPTVQAVAEALGATGEADPSPWTWLPNVAMTRLHACHEAERYVWRGERRAAAACGITLPVPTVALYGDLPPKCKRCLKAVEG